MYCNKDNHKVQAQMGEGGQQSHWPRPVACKGTKYIHFNLIVDLLFLAYHQYSFTLFKGKVKISLLQAMEAHRVARG
jgi:hypothetical protein